ncbi:MAG: NUDIX hydrolase [Pseudomonadota bacterium]
MKFCSQCGAEVELKIPDGDNRERYVCPSCHFVHYQNPLIVTGCVAEWEGQILLCRRAIEPRHGFWTVPAGFMENGESVAQGAARETWEEALARVTTTSLLAVVNVVHAKQVHLFYRGRLEQNEYGVGQESLDTRLVDEADIPWDDMAFPSVTYALRAYLEDRAAGVENIHETDIHWRRPKQA